MSWDEKLFRWSLLKAQSLFSTEISITDEEREQVRLSDITVRVKTLASALAGKSIEIKEAESVGGPIGETLFLPSVMRLAPDREWNKKAYLYRTAFSMAFSPIKLSLPVDFHESPHAQLLMSLLSVPSVRLYLKKNYPGLQEIEAQLLTFELKLRMKKSTGEPWQKLTAALLSGETPESSKPWLVELVRNPPLSREQVEAATRRLLPAFMKGDRAKTGILERMPSIWGLILPDRGSLHSGLQSSGSMPAATEESLPSGTEKKGKPKESVEEVKLREDKEGENPLVHAFEKVHTLDDYVGGRKVLDGADELEEQLEALQELDLRKVVRTRERTDSIYKSDVMLEGAAGDVQDSEDEGLAEFLYDEWDIGARTYKKDWCKVFIEHRGSPLPAETVTQYVKEVRQRNVRQIRELRQHFEQFALVRRWRTRQPDGPEIDIDAVVDRYATLASGHSTNNFLYLSQKPRERDFATLVLLDSSLSTDSWLKNRRIMDVLKESMVVLGDVIAEHHDRLAIGAFFSNTRKDCRYVEIKKFNETWSSCLPRLIGLRPTGYTRIGPALRHGTYLLSQVPARKKLLLLISDGKATDYDRYEGRYGIEDVRQALREAASDHIVVRAVAIEATAKFYLPQMFGKGNFQILPSPQLLARTLADTYGWLSV